MNKTSLMFLGSSGQKYAKISLTKGKKIKMYTESFATGIEAHGW